ncbi:MAG: gephyrin-like molybdotransferase receptor GlpR, partial [Nakamurella sp.]
MSIPTSLIVVLLVVAWLVVLVPMVARRRERVPQSEAESGGTGFRVLRRASASLRRRPVRRPKGQTVANSDRPAAETSGAAPRITKQTTTTQGFAGGNVIDAPTDALVTVGADQQPQDAAEEWAAAHTSSARPAVTPPAAFNRPDDGIGRDEPGVTEGSTDVQASGHGDRVLAGSTRYEPQADWAPPTEPGVRFVPDLPDQPTDTDDAGSDTTGSTRIPDEMTEQEWAEHAAAAPAGTSYNEVDDEQLRPVPLRRGRGGFDPEAAEVTRAYKYQQRRRVTLILFLSTVVFTLAAMSLINWLWVGAVASLALLVGYLVYLRRQVRIEAAIRQRRMERLQRARQIRPESGRAPRRVRAGSSALAPGRTVVDLDDDDPAFDDL